jgi:hypothetical protein
VSCPGCNGACDQGRRPCPHPEQCEQNDGVPLREVLAILLWPVVLVGLCWLVVSLLVAR